MGSGKFIAKRLALLHCSISKKPLDPQKNPCYLQLDIFTGANVAEDQKHNTKRVIGLSIIGIIFFTSLIPAALRTAELASDARGLIIIATSSSKDWLWNPYAKDALYVGPEPAVWILKNFEYPYQKCSDLHKALGSCEVPLVSWLGRTLDNKDHDSQERGYELLAYLIRKGEPLNARADGMTPLHEAILFKNARYLDALLLSGADPLIKSDMQHKTFRGVNAYEFLALLDLKHPKDREEIHKSLDKYRRRNRAKTNREEYFRD